MRTFIIAISLLLISFLSMGQAAAKEIVDIMIIYQKHDEGGRIVEVPFSYDLLKQADLMTIIGSATEDPNYNEGIMLNEMMNKENYKIFVKYSDNTEDIYNVFDPNYFYWENMKKKMLNTELLPHMQNLFPREGEPPLEPGPAL